jgi:hypothetical protein
LGAEAIPGQARTIGLMPDEGPDEDPVTTQWRALLTGVLVSGATWERAGLGSPPAQREVEIAGRTGSLTVVVEGAAPDPAEPVSA